MNTAETVINIPWKNFAWSDPNSYPPERIPLLVEFSEGDHVAMAVVTFLKGSDMFGPKFDFRHCLNYVEQHAKIQVRRWFVLPELTK